MIDYFGLKKKKRKRERIEWGDGRTEEPYRVGKESDKPRKVRYKL